MHNDQREVVVKSLSRKTLSKQVEEQVIQLLVSGQLKPGDKLPTEMELLEKLEVSRPVLREALSSLESLGVIKRKTREGTFFSEKISSEPFSVMLALSIGRIKEIIEARMSLELGLVTLAAEKITDQQLELLRENIDKMKTADDSYPSYDREFHQIIALTVNNNVVAGMIDSLLIAFDKMSAEIQIRHPKTTIEHHEAIFSALQKRDPHAAFAAMYQHLDFVRQKILLEGDRLN